VLCISVPLPPSNISCHPPTTSSVKVTISPPDASLSFSIDFYEITYKSVVERFSKIAVHTVTYTNEEETADALTEADAGVTYDISVVSISGHLSSQTVMTTCTAGQLVFFIQHNISSLILSLFLSINMMDRQKRRSVNIKIREVKLNHSFHHYILNMLFRKCILHLGMLHCKFQDTAYYISSKSAKLHGNGGKKKHLGLFLVVHNVYVLTAFSSILCSSHVAHDCKV